MSLNEKQKQFCEEYIIDLNATQAAIRAGYSEKTANRIGFENLTKLDIQEYIAELQKERNKRLEITQDDVLRDIIELKNRCMQMVPVKVKGVQIRDEKGNNIWKFDSQGAGKALDMLAKHTGVYEIDNKQKNSVINLLDAAEKIKKALK